MRIAPLGLWALLMTTLVGMPAGAQEGAPAPAGDGEQHFRIGFNGYATFDHYGGDHAAMKIGAAVVLPHFDVMIKYGLGLRLGFVVHYHQAENGSVAGTGELAGVDLTYYEEYQDPGSVTTAERVPGYIFSYGMSINFKYEVTVPETDPSYRFFRWVQPYFGTGVVISWTRTHTDIPKEMSVLIENEAYRGADPEADYDPWSNQLAPAFNLFGGMHFNVDPKFRINLEVGYYLVDVPEAELMYATSGHEAVHEPYKLNDFNLGGGFEWKF